MDNSLQVVKLFEWKIVKNKQTNKLKITIFKILATFLTVMNILQPITEAVSNQIQNPLPLDIFVTFSTFNFKTEK